MAAAASASSSNSDAPPGTWAIFELETRAKGYVTVTARNYGLPNEEVAQAWVNVSTHYVRCIDPERAKGLIFVAVDTAVMPVAVTITVPMRPCFKSAGAGATHVELTLALRAEETQLGHDDEEFNRMQLAFPEEVLPKLRRLRGKEAAAEAAAEYSRCIKIMERVRETLMESDHLLMHTFLYERFPDLPAFRPLRTDKEKEQLRQEQIRFLQAHGLTAKGKAENAAREWKPSFFHEPYTMYRFLWKLHVLEKGERPPPGLYIIRESLPMDIFPHIVQAAAPAARKRPAEGLVTEEEERPQKRQRHEDDDEDEDEDEDASSENDDEDVDDE